MGAAGPDRRPPRRWRWLLFAAAIVVAVFVLWRTRPARAPALQWISADTLAVRVAEPVLMLAFRVDRAANGASFCAPVLVGAPTQPPARLALARLLPVGTTEVRVRDVADAPRSATSTLSTVFVEAGDPAARRRFEGLLDALEQARRLVEQRNGEWLAEAEFRAFFAAGRGGAAAEAPLEDLFAGGAWQANGLCGHSVGSSPFAPAPEPEIEGLQVATAVLPGGLEARIDGARAGAFVVLLLGECAGDIPLPGGQALGVVPAALLGVALANGDGMATVGFHASTEACAGLAFLAQALAIDPGAPLEHPGAVAVSSVQRLQVPARASAADVYVLFGQSNAEGYAEAAGLPADLRGPQPRCRIWNAATATFQPLTAGSNGRTLTPVSWCGPELTLGRSLTADGRVVYLVKFAVGGTALGATPGPWNEWGAEAGELYAVLQQWLADACAALRAEGLQPRVRGICMMQGESDAMDAAWAAGYQGLLATLVQRFRNDLAGAGAADQQAVPFAIGLINKDLPPGEFPHILAVRAAQLAVAQGAPRCTAVDASALPLCTDGVHFDTAGVMALGCAFAAGLRALGP